MKLLILFLLIPFLFLSCNKEEQPKDPCLPAAPKTNPIICNLPYFMDIVDADLEWKLSDNSNSDVFIGDKYVYKLDRQTRQVEELNSEISFKCYYITDLSKKFDNYSWVSYTGNDYKYYVAQLNNNGNLIKNITIDKITWHICATADTGFILVRNNDILVSECFIEKYSKNGNKMWNNSNSLFEILANKIVESPSRNYFIIGENKYHNPTFIKINKNGGLLFSKTYSDINGTIGSIFIPTTSELYLSIYNYSSTPFLIKADTVGNTIWRYDFKGNLSDLKLIDGFLYLLINEYKNPNSSSNRDIKFVKLDLNGNILFTNEYGGDGDETGYFFNKINDGFLIYGTTDNATGAPCSSKLTGYIIKVDFDGQPCR